MNNQYVTFSMKIGYFQLLLALSLQIEFIGAKTIEKTIQVSIIQEKINDTRFMHRLESVDGKRTEVCTINGTLVDHDEYEEAILSAEKEERRIDRQKEYESECKKHEEINNLQRTGLIKLINLYHKQINDFLKKISDNRLKPYLAFNVNTVTQDQFKDLTEQILTRISKINAGEEELSISDLQKLVPQLEFYVDRIEQLYWNTIKIAQERSDDTRLLKDLLSLTTEHLVD